MRKLLIALSIAAASAISVYAETAATTSSTIGNTGIPSWVSRVVILVILFIGATRPMWGDLQVYLRDKYGKKKHNQDTDKEE